MKNKTSKKEMETRPFHPLLNLDLKKRYVVLNQNDQNYEKKTK